MSLQVAHSQGYINRDVRLDNIDGETEVMYLVDWGSALRRFGTALPSEGTVQFLAARSGSAIGCQRPSCQLYILNPEMI